MLTNIYTNVEVEQVASQGTIIYAINFDGVAAQVDNQKPTDDQLHWFKKGVLGERERAWDECLSIDINTLKSAINEIELLYKKINPDKNSNLNRNFQSVMQLLKDS